MHGLRARAALESTLDAVVAHAVAGDANRLMFRTCGTLKRRVKALDVFDTTLPAHARTQIRRGVRT